MIQQGAYDAALIELDRQAEQYPDDPLLLRLRGTCEMKVEQIDSAVETLRGALAGSTEAVADSNRWNLYLKAGAEYDDNVPARPDGADGETPQESWRAVYSAYGGVRFPDQKVDDLPITFGIGGSVNGSYHDE